MGDEIDELELIKPKPIANNLFSLTRETEEIDRDFRSSLHKFGLEQHYIDRFDSEMDELYVDHLDEESVKKQQIEADHFLKCIELEELIEATEDPTLKQQYQQSLELLQNKKS